MKAFFSHHRNYDSWWISARDKYFLSAFWFQRISKNYFCFSYIYSQRR